MSGLGGERGAGRAAASRRLAAGVRRPAPRVAASVCALWLSLATGAAAAAAGPLPGPTARPEPAPVAVAAPAARGPVPGDRPQLLPAPSGPLVGVPQLLTPALAAGPYVFPVFGASSVLPSYGAPGPGGGYDHGDDLPGELGQPLVAAAAGTVFGVGWTRAAGNRLWLRDRQGNLFAYAGLAAFTPGVRDGAHVRAGEVVGFMGSTGTAGEPRLHFEVYPVSLLYLGADGAVDPTSYLRSWRHVAQLALPVAAGWSPRPAAVAAAPAPGAVLLGSVDIASAGLAVARRG